MSDHSRTETTKEEIILELTECSLPKAEANLIHKVLQETNWNLRQTAMELEIARGTLYSKMKKHNIKRPALLNDYCRDLEAINSRRNNLEMVSMDTITI